MTPFDPEHLITRLYPIVRGMLLVSYDAKPYVDQNSGTETITVDANFQFIPDCVADLAFLQPRNWVFSTTKYATPSDVDKELLWFSHWQTQQEFGYYDNLSSWRGFEYPSIPIDSTTFTIPHWDVLADSKGYWAERRGVFLWFYSWVRRIPCVVVSGIFKSM
jgi:hypothetical protein